MKLEQQFLNVVSKYPNKTAIIYGDKSITYAELSDSISRCKDCIVRKISDGRIGLIADQSVDAITYIMATIFTGKTIIPIDPRLNASDIGAMLQELTGSLIVHDEFQGSVDSLATYRFADLIKIEGEAPDRRGLALVGGDSDAYILHTSGTTGRPKPVLASVGSLQLISDRLAGAYHIDKDSSVVQFAYLSFDSAFVEIWSTLLAGGTLIIPGKEIREDLYGTLRDIARNHSDITLTLPPSVAKGLDDSILGSIKTLVLAGEELPSTLANELLGKVEYLINAYGPTESIICATTYEIREKIAGRVPIGKSLEGMNVILDPQTKEMLLYSHYLANGYIGVDDESSFSTDKDGRYYRTGDMATINDRGDYVFLGRLDRQVKLNGQRIELEGLESKLRNSTNNSQIYVVDLVTGGENIMLYCLYKNAEAYDIAYLNSFLPKNISLVDALGIDNVPLNTNGKADYGKLRDLLHERKESSGPTQNDSQYEAMIEIWGRVFGADVFIEKDTPFFDIGGDSLVALKLVSLINDKYSVELKIADIISNDTPGMLTELLGRRS